MGANKVILLGRLGKDPELRFASAADDLAICNFNIATNERRKDSDGNWTTHTEWHTVVCFGKTAENSARYLHKGSEVYVEGRLSTNKWEDAEGVKHSKTEVIAQSVQFVGSGKAKAETAEEPSEAALTSLKTADEVADQSLSTE